MMKLRNILKSFDQFEELDPLSERELQDYTSMYLDLQEAKIIYPEPIGDGEEVPPDDSDDDFDLELIKSIEVDFDFIYELIRTIKETPDLENKTIQETSIQRIVGLINMSPSLRHKKDLIVNFIENVDVQENNFDEK
ncbi:hypothetical protein Zmor_008944 [Zophobas morio]|uniref:Type I restriction enzyme R protein C-terminal domain-containing protein n=1 Tax=Zophobas morio TaxID=2755281 RepID=A0AA38HHP0_9CUCU|nr:hypothetical protein Zmor_008944 [Zophobas morio]